MAERGVDVAKLLSGLYLPETTFARSAERVDASTARVTHTLTDAQCAPRKTEMLRGAISLSGDTATNRKTVDDEITLGHFTTFRLLAGHQGFGMLLAAGMHDRQMWWTGVRSISFQTPCAPGDEMTAAAKIIKDDESGRLINGTTRRDGGTHTRAREILLEDADPGEISGTFVPQNTWLEIGAHFGGGGIAALGEFPGDDFAPMYLGTGEVMLPKKLGRPGDELTGTVTLNSVEYMDVPGLGNLKVISVDEVISNGKGDNWEFSELEFGFLPKKQLEEAIRQR